MRYGALRGSAGTATGVAAQMYGAQDSRIGRKALLVGHRHAGHRFDGHDVVNRWRSGRPRWGGEVKRFAAEGAVRRVGKNDGASLVPCRASATGMARDGHPPRGEARGSHRGGSPSVQMSSQKKNEGGRCL